MREKQALNIKIPIGVKSLLDNLSLKVIYFQIVPFTIVVS